MILVESVLSHCVYHATRTWSYTNSNSILRVADLPYGKQTTFGKGMRKFELETVLALLYKANI